MKHYKTFGQTGKTYLRERSRPYAVPPQHSTPPSQQMESVYEPDVPPQFQRAIRQFDRPGKRARTTIDQVIEPVEPPHQMMQPPHPQMMQPPHPQMMHQEPHPQMMHQEPHPQMMHQEPQRPHFDPSQQPPPPTMQYPTQCPDIHTHIMSCPVCSKIYRRNNNTYISIIICLILFIVFLLTKVVDKLA